MKDLKHHPRADTDPIVTKMKQYASHTHLVYAESGLYAFHAQLPMPPELAVVTLKRFWSGQITTQNIVETCQRDHPEQLLLNPAKITDDWNELLKNYEIVYRDTNFVLFASNQLKLN